VNLFSPDVSVKATGLFPPKIRVASDGWLYKEVVRRRWVALVGARPLQVRWTGMQALTPRLTHVLVQSVRDDESALRRRRSRKQSQVARCTCVPMPPATPAQQNRGVAA